MIVRILPRARLLALAGLLVLLVAGCTKAPASVNQVKIAVDTSGLYEITPAALRETGFDLASASAGDLTLTTGGQPVAFQLTGRGASAVLRFYGEALPPDAHTPRNIYWLKRGSGAALPVEERNAQPTAGVAGRDAISNTLTVQEDKLYHGQGGSGEPGETLWYWESIFAPTKIERTLDVRDPAEGSALLRIYVLAASSAPVDPDHRLILTVNGAEIANATWDGLGPHVVEAPVPAGVLMAGENKLVLSAPGDTGAPADSLLLDRIELTYPRKLVVTSQLAWQGSASAFRVTMAAKGKNDASQLTVWDVTDPLKPAQLTGAVEKDGAFVFRGVRGEHEFVAAAPGGFLAPADIKPAMPASAASLPDWPGGADLIIVTVPQLREALAPLVAVRKAQGLRVAVLDVEQVNDGFAYGRSGPEAIRSLVRYAADHWPKPAPRYLLLAGDASYDPLNRLKGTEADLVPTRLVHTAFSGWTASDVWYALPDDEPGARPTLAVGRLPAQTPAQLTAMVDKALAYEKAADAGDWRNKVLLVADNDEPGFAEESQDFAARLSRYAAELETIQDDGANTRNRLAGAFDEGRGLIGYFGHGSITLWAKEKVLATEDAEKLANEGRLPVVFTVTCLTGFFDNPRTPSLAEALLRNTKGGAVAALVPSSAAVLADQKLLAQALADELAVIAPAPRRLGDIVQAAQVDVPVQGKGVEEILQTFNLLGDPTLITSF